MIGLCLLAIIFTNSCSLNSTKSDYSEVDFSSEVKVNFEYNFEVFDALIKYENECLYFKYSNNCGTMSGSEVTVNAENYSFFSNDLKFSGKTNELNDNFLPLIIYNLLFENNGLIKTQLYDESKNCYYFEESLSNQFIRFEVYEHEKTSSYVMIIT